MNVFVNATNKTSKDVTNVPSSTHKIQKVTAAQISLKILQSKKDSFIEAFKASHSNITHSAAKIGISRDLYYKWLETDSAFAMAILHAQEAMTDQIRANLITEASDNHDMTAIIFYLKHKDPSFKEESQGGRNTQINIYSDKVSGGLKALSEALKL